MTTRRWMATVAILAGALLMATEGRYWHQQAKYHAHQEKLCSWESMRFSGDGKGALAAGRGEDAARLFAKSNYWSEKARGHHTMGQMCQRVWWLPGL